MKKRISLLISALLLINALFVGNVFAAGVLTVDDESTLEYKVGDTINIKGTCTEKTDVILRVYDKNNALIITDVVPASQTTDGTYIFNDITIPETNTSSNVTYTAIISSPGAENVTKSIVVGNGKNTSSGGGGGGGSSVVTPSVKWTDSIEKVIEKVDEVKTEENAEKVIKDITNKTDDESLATEDTRSTIATATETMVSNISAKTVKASSNRLNINKKTLTVSDLSKVENTMKALKNALSQNKLQLNRDLFKELILNVKFDSTKEAVITISSEVINLLEQVDILTIASDDYRVSYMVPELVEALGDQQETTLNIFQPIKTSTTGKANADGSVAKVNVTFNTDKTNQVKVSFAGIKGDTTYMAVVDEDGNPVGGKYNPATGCIEAKISASGVYSVVYNEEDFTDIKDKSKEMQAAIKKLASVGVIEGTSETRFAPDDSISRAELAALILRVTDSLDPNADGDFDDVTRSDWYFGTAGSAKQQGIINGFEDNTFRANLVITKDQILVISARTLKTKMRYYTPENPEEYLAYADSSLIPDWAKEDIAVATVADLVVRNTDNKFNSGSDMTRGDAAIIIMKLFEKIW